MSSTFGSFNTVRLGIYAAQKGLDVTGNNITNINTNGYTRQRLDQVSLSVSAADQYASQYKTHIGQGVVVNGVSQLRDPGLDIAYRQAQTNVGASDAWLAGLEDLAKILDEVGKGDGEQDDGVILNQLNDLRDLISQAVTNGLDTSEGAIRASAKSLVGLFNQYASELTQLQEKTATDLNQDVDRVNSLLSNIQELNIAIRDADIRGDAALELRDNRNLMLDSLSQYIGIDVTYSMEDAGAGLMVEKLSVSFTGEDGKTKYNLIDGEYAAQLSVLNGQDPDDPTVTYNYDLSLSPLTDMDGVQKDPNAKDVTLLDNDTHGSLQALRELLTEEGEYASQDDINEDPKASSKRGIPYYQNALDSLAREFATQMNALNKDNDDPAQHLEGSGVLFTNGTVNDGTDGITAANISISNAWTQGDVHMIASRDPNAPSGDRSNLGEFLNLFNSDFEFDPKDVVADAVGSPYQGSFEDMLLHTESTLAEDQMSATSVLNNYAVTLDSIYTDRDSISGVDLNDETTSLMMYQKAYTAACRLMTVLEEALDSLINGTVV